MYRFLTISKDYSDRDTGVRSVEAEIICDSVIDLPTNTSDLIFLIGSKADVISSGAVYKINSSGVWILQPIQSIQLDLSEYYKSSQADALFQKKSDMSAYYKSNQVDSLIADFIKIKDVFGGVGAKIIPSGADLNTATYAQPGCYMCENSAIAASLVNCPVNYGGFVLLVFSSGNRYRVILPTTGGGTQIFIETVTGAGATFNAWYKLVGTAV